MISRKTWTCILIVSGIAFTLAIASKYGSANLSKLENVYYASQITTAIVVLIGGIVGVWQYYLSSKDSRNNLAITQVQRAIDLSEYYKDNILKVFPAINYVYEKTGIMAILKKVSIHSMDDFDSQELNRLLNPDDIRNLKDIQSSPEFTKYVLEANAIYNLHLPIRPLNIAEKHTPNTDNSQTVTISLTLDDKSLSRAFMSNLVEAMNNNLEYFALHFNHNTADESVVYQSLHQTYFQIVTSQYYYIASINNSGESNKYYTNVIWLFKKWRSRYSTQLQEQNHRSEKIISHGTKIQN